MIQFKPKNLVVACGVDFMCQVVVTTESGHTIAMPLELFKVFFEPEDDDAKDWLRAIEKRWDPKPFDYEMTMTPGEDGQMKVKGKGSGGGL